MNDDALRTAYRALTARAGTTVPEGLATLAEGRSLGDGRDAALGEIAGSARNADLLRAVLALAPDAEALSRDVARLRRPSQATAPRRLRWLALAACLALASFSVALLRTSPVDAGGDPPTLAAPAADTAIMSASFEGDAVVARDDARIFSSDFDS